MQGGTANLRVLSAIPYWMSCSARKGGPGRRSVDGGWRTRTSVTPAPQDPRSLPRLSIPTSHLGGGSQTGRAPFILEIGNGQVLVHAVCVTATVLTYHELPCLLNTEHDGSPARLNRTAINNKNCQILGGIDHSDRLEINLGVGQRWLTQWPFLGQSVSPLVSVPVCPGQCSVCVPRPSCRVRVWSLALYWPTAVK